MEYDNAQAVIRERVGIRAAYDRYIGGQVNRQGLALCPFHGEKTPSFKLFYNNNSFYCFGCRIGGNVINLCARALNISYSDAIRRINDDFQLHLSVSKKPITDLQRSKTATKAKRREHEAEKTQERERADYELLTNYYKWLRNQPDSVVKEFQINYLDRLLNRYTQHHSAKDCYVSLPFRAEALIDCLYEKITEGGGKSEQDRNS